MDWEFSDVEGIRGLTEMLVATAANPQETVLLYPQTSSPPVMDLVNILAS